MQLAPDGNHNEKATAKAKEEEATGEKKVTATTTKKQSETSNHPTFRDSRNENYDSADEISADESLDIESTPGAHGIAGIGLGGEPDNNNDDEDQVLVSAEVVDKEADLEREEEIRERIRQDTTMAEVVEDSEKKPAIPKIAIATIIFMVIAIVLGVTLNDNRNDDGSNPDDNIINATAFPTTSPTNSPTLVPDQEFYMKFFSQSQEQDSTIGTLRPFKLSNGCCTMIQQN